MRCGKILIAFALAAMMMVVSFAVLASDGKSDDIEIIEITDDTETKDFCDGQAHYDAERMELYLYDDAVIPRICVEYERYGEGNVLTIIVGKNVTVGYDKTMGYASIYCQGCSLKITGETLNINANLCGINFYGEILGGVENFYIDSVTINITYVEDGAIPEDYEGTGIFVDMDENLFIKNSTISVKNMPDYGIHSKGTFTIDDKSYVICSFKGLASEKEYNAFCSASGFTSLAEPTGDNIRYYDTTRQGDEPSEWNDGQINKVTCSSKDKDTVSAYFGVPPPEPTPEPEPANDNNGIIIAAVVVVLVIAVAGVAFYMKKH